MFLLFDADGSELVTDTETELFTSQTVPATYFCNVFCQNMESGDVYIIRTYIRDENTATERVLYNDQISFSLIKDKPAYYIPPIPTDSFRVTVQKISGVDRIFTWRRGTY